MGSNIEKNAAHQRKYKGIRRRKWGKWVSEIRVPGSQERLWLGSYATQEAAAMAHDVAFYCLRRPRSLDGLNFPSMLPASVVHAELSPKSVQKAASDAGMGVDAQMVLNKDKTDENENENSGATQVLDEKQFWEYDYEFEDCGTSEEGELNISVEDYLKTQVDH
ncbi:hypothetical protein AB3S75_027442 [Citrus x aurantiifolia]